MKQVMEQTELKVKIDKTIADIKRIIESSDKDKAAGRDYYCYAIPHVLKDAQKYGADKIFYVSQNYRGLYEDDYCTFTYWNEVTKEFFTDEWTTAAACPNFGLYETPIPFEDGWNAGLIDKDGFLSYCKRIELMHVENSSADQFRHLEWPLKQGLRVKVGQGRKWKGDGFLVDTHERSFRFATPSFRTRYSDVFGVSTTRTALIFDDKSNEIHECNAEYVHFVDLGDIIDSYKEWATSLIDGMTTDNLKMGARVPVLDVDISMDTFLVGWKKAHPMPDASGARHPEREAREKKEADFKQSKMAELVEWVKNNTDKKGDEVLALAEHIYNKRYARPER